VNFSCNKTEIDYRYMDILRTLDTDYKKWEQDLIKWRNMQLDIKAPYYQFSNRIDLINEVVRNKLEEIKILKKLTK